MNGHLLRHTPQVALQRILRRNIAIKCDFLADGFGRVLYHYRAVIHAARALAQLNARAAK